MGGQQLTGLVVVMAAGLLNAVFAIPMRYNQCWKWENTWLVFTLCSLAVLPCLLVLSFVHHAGQLFGSLVIRDLGPPILFGFLWGIAQSTFGLSIELLGVAAAIPVVSAIAIILGALVPVMASRPGALLGHVGVVLSVSAGLLVGGLVLYSQATRLRDSTGAKRSLKGLILAVVTGVTGGTINIGFALSGKIMHRAELLGNGAAVSTYPVWALLLAAGFIPNSLYCFYLLRRNATWSCFTSAGSKADFLRSVLMAVAWISATALYGVSITYMGKLGTTIGYLAYGSFTILFANLLGWKTGEWTNAPPSALRSLWGATGLVLGGVGVLGLVSC